ncbi:MAG: T9SS type A sorting domain-containing protein [Fibrobacteres bacterium]|nr:T9SS type A sorting domain-containing protein [Fibrobacterota bacterium]
MLTIFIRSLTIVLVCFSFSFSQIYFKFNDVEPTQTIDYSGNDNHGQNSGTWDIDAPLSGALYECSRNFNQTSLISINSNRSFNNLNGMTFSVWIKLAANGQYQTLIAKGQENVSYDYLIDISDKNRLRFCFYPNRQINWRIYENDQWAPKIDRWYMVTVTVNKQTNKVSFYIDGQLSCEKNATLDYTFTTGQVKVGALTATRNHFLGGMDELLLQPYCMTSNDVKNLYSKTPNQVLVYNMHSEQEAIIKDYSGQQNDAITFGQPTIVTDEYLRWEGAYLDGNGTSYFEAPSSTSLEMSGNMSFFFDVYLSSLGKYHAVFAKGAEYVSYDYMVDVSPTNHLRFCFYPNTSVGWRIFENTALTLTKNCWYNFAIIVNQSTKTISFYQGGVKNQTISATLDFKSSQNSIKIGTMAKNKNGLHGMINKLNFYNYAINEADVELMTEYFSMPMKRHVDTLATSSKSSSGYDLVVSPTPFNPTTNIIIPTGVDLAKANVKIYNIAGKIVADLSNLKNNKIQWNASSLPSGQYVVKLLTPNKIMTKKVTLLR